MLNAGASAMWSDVWLFFGSGNGANGRMVEAGGGVAGTGWLSKAVLVAVNVAGTAEVLGGLLLQDYTAIAVGMYPGGVWCTGIALARATPGGPLTGIATAIAGASSCFIRGA
eukprot:151366_1